MDLETIFGQGHFIRRIPESQLSTPEDYLDSIRSPDVVADVVEKTTAMSEEDDDIDEESGFIVTNEETPLLSGK